MGDIINYRSRRSHEETTAYVGMVIFLGSWAMLFAGLFFVYGAVRLRAPVWPPPGQGPLPVALPAINTLVLALSSAAMQAGLTLLRRGHTRALAPFLGTTAILGMVFLGLQTVVWSRVAKAGLKPASGPYASAFYGLTWFHALHVGVGLIALLWLSFRAVQGAYSLPRHQSVRLWTMYWHFVGVVWGVMFLTVYVI
ncbi:MAG TPA: heme-copper oxidase subunit III [Polyangia bacterium]|nr:heme-copper oxidase subunit III [Polyangia bacterium]